MASRPLLVKDAQQIFGPKSQNVVCYLQPVSNIQQQVPEVIPINTAPLHQVITPSVRPASGTSVVQMVMGPGGQKLQLVQANPGPPKAVLSSAIQPSPGSTIQLLGGPGSGSGVRLQPQLKAVNVTPVRIAAPSTVCIPTGNVDSAAVKPSDGGAILRSSDGRQIQLQMTNMGGQVGFSIPAGILEPNTTFTIQTDNGTELHGVMAGSSQFRLSAAPKPTPPAQRTPQLHQSPFKMTWSTKKLAPTAQAAPASISLSPAAELGSGTPSLGERVISFESLPEAQQSQLLRQIEDSNLVGSDDILEEIVVSHESLLLGDMSSMVEALGDDSGSDVEFVSMQPPQALLEDDISEVVTVSAPASDTHDSAVVLQHLDPTGKKYSITQPEIPHYQGTVPQTKQTEDWSIAIAPLSNSETSKKNVRNLSFPIKIGNEVESSEKESGECHVALETATKPALNKNETAKQVSELSNGDFVTLPAQVTMLPQFPPGHKPPQQIESEITTTLLQKVVRAAGLEIPSTFLGSGDKKDGTPQEKDTTDKTQSTSKKSNFKIVGCLTFGCGISEQLFAPRLILPRIRNNIADVASMVDVDSEQVLDLQAKQRREASSLVKAAPVIVPELFLTPFEDAGNIKLGDRGQLSKSAIEMDDMENSKLLGNDVLKEGNQLAETDAGPAHSDQENSLSKALDQLTDKNARQGESDEENTEVEFMFNSQEENALDDGLGDKVVCEASLDREEVQGKMSALLGDKVVGEASLDQEEVQGKMSDLLGDHGNSSQSAVDDSEQQIVQEETSVEMEEDLKDDANSKLVSEDTKTDDMPETITDEHTKTNSEEQVACTETVEETVACTETVDENLIQELDEENLAESEEDMEEVSQGLLGDITGKQELKEGDDLKEVDQGSVTGTPELKESEDMQKISEGAHRDVTGMLESKEDDNMEEVSQETSRDVTGELELMDGDDMKEVCKDATETSNVDTCLVVEDSTGKDADDESVTEISIGSALPSLTVDETVVSEDKDNDGCLVREVNYGIQKVAKVQDVQVVEMGVESGENKADESGCEVDKPHTTYGCYLCTFASFRHQAIVEHWLNHHLPQQPYQCCYCEHNSLSSQQIAEHCLEEHPSATPLVVLPASDIYQQRIVLEMVVGKKELSMPSVDLRNYKNFGEDFLAMKVADNEPSVAVSSRIKVTYHCISCSYDSDNVRSMRQHVRLSHVKAHPYVCTHCQRCFTSELEAQRHMKLIHPEKTHDLQVVPRRYVDISLHCLNEHFDVTFDESPITQPNDETFSPPGPYWSEATNPLNQKFLKCGLCVFTSPKLAKMLVHVRTVHELPAGMTCPRCRKMSTLKSKDRQQCWATCSHCRSLIPLYCNPKLTYTLGTRMYMCLCCNYRTHERSGVLRHVKYQHVKVQAFSCPYCNYRGVEKPKVRMHVMVHHHGAAPVVLKNMRMLQKYYDVVRGMFKEVLLDKSHLRRYKPEGLGLRPYKKQEAGLALQQAESMALVNMGSDAESEEINVEDVEEEYGSNAAKTLLKRGVSGGSRSEAVPVQLFSAKSIRKRRPPAGKFRAKKKGTCMSDNLMGVSFNVDAIEAAKNPNAKSKGTGKVAKSLRELLGLNHLEISKPNQYRYYMSNDFKGVSHYRCLICHYCCLDRSCMGRHIKYIHLKAHPHLCSYCKYSNVEKTKVKAHMSTVHVGLPSNVITNHQMISALAKMVKQYYVLVHKSGRQEAMIEYSDVLELRSQLLDANAMTMEELSTTEACLPSMMEQAEGIPLPVVKLENAEDEGGSWPGMGDLLPGQTMEDLIPEITIKTEPGDDVAEGSTVLRLTTGNDDQDDSTEDGSLNDIEHLLATVKRENEELLAEEGERPAKRPRLIRISAEVMADPKIKMMPVVEVEDIVQKILSSCPP